MFRAVSKNHVVINDTITVDGKTYLCERITKGAFSRNQEITSLEIKAKRMSIEEGAFEECLRLKSVIFSSSSQEEYSIGANAFSGCIKLKTLKLPMNLKLIGDFAFRDCLDLVAADDQGNLITIHGGVEYLGREAFSNCANLKGIIIYKQITKVRSYVFRGIVNDTFKVHIKGASAIPDSWHIYFNFNKASVVFE